MPAFMDEDFLLHTPAAKALYNEVRSLPIVDFHCHIPPADIAEDKKFTDISDLWFGGDHYKWRLMRANGVPEEYVTGPADPYEKFVKWCETIEDCIGSPLYHWTHLELRRYFGWEGVLSRDTAKEAWDFCNEVLGSPDFSVWPILRKFKVETLCTTDDPCDDLRWHRQIKASGLPCSVLPAFRPSKVFEAETPGFSDYVKKMSGMTNLPIACFSDLCKAMSKRMDFFHENGCRLADHSLEGFSFTRATQAELDEILGKGFWGRPVTKREADQFKSALLLFLHTEYHRRNWVSQIRFGALRNNNTRMTRTLKIDGAGYDSISDEPIALTLSRLLDALEEHSCLPKTILYSLDPSANATIASMAGNFQSGGVKGKMQFGAAWWFNDTKAGMRSQMTTLSDMGMLARFVGMLTDSRSFLSYTRHEYFRRVLAGLLGEWVENGEYPEDDAKLAKIAGDISYHNAKEYFGF